MYSEEGSENQWKIPRCSCILRFTIICILKPKVLRFCSNIHICENGYGYHIKSIIVALVRHGLEKLWELALSHYDQRKVGIIQVLFSKTLLAKVKWLNTEVLSHHF